MASIRVTHHIDDLADDVRAIAVRAKADMARVVKTNVTEGNKIARQFARESSGPHGLNYFKRITAEMRGPLEGEYGPTGNVVENAVGAGWRGGPVNTDLPRSADLISPRFKRAVSDQVDGWFW